MGREVLEVGMKEVGVELKVVAEEIGGGDVGENSFEGPVVTMSDIGEVE